MAVYETWGRYLYTDIEVSNLGSVRRMGKLNKLKTYSKEGGYVYLSTTLNGKKTTLTVHRMVAEVFVKNPMHKPCVNHKDGDKQNNRVENLQWVSYSENSQHAYDTGLQKKVFGEAHHRSKLTEDIVKEIKQRYIPRCRINGTRALAIEFGVKHQTISDIINHKIWRDLS